jgi:hypothetical protein
MYVFDAFLTLFDCSVRRLVGFAVDIQADAVRASLQT